MKAEPGELVRLTYTSAVAVLAGDYLRTRTGRTYLVETVRPRGRRFAQAIGAIVMPEDFELDEEHDTVHPLHWASRSRR